MKFVLQSCLALSIIMGLTACHNRTAENESGDLDMDGMEQAMRQEFKMTRDPLLNTVPRERLELAKQQAQSIMSLRTMALSWVERGPNNIGGRTRAILVDRSDASGNTVFAGSVSGGIFKTTNFTAATPVWAPVNDQMLNLAVTALVQDKNNASIMYAGTGEGWFNIDGLRGAGVFKSTDGGATWTRLPSTAGYEYVQDVVVDNNSNVYVSLRNATTTNRGVLRSTDGGTTWTQVLGAPLPGFATGRAADLEVASNGDIYATLGVFSRTQVMKSTVSINGVNTGAIGTWVDITPVHTTPTQRGKIVSAPSNAQRLYLMMQDSASSQIKTLYRSSDGGTVWDSIPAPGALNNGAVSQNWYNLTAAVDPNNPDILVVGGFHIARSVDAGNNFTDINVAGVHVDQHELVYVSSTSLIVGNDGGIYYSTNVNSGSPSFSNRNNGYNVTQFYGADLHPTNTNYFLAGAQDNNTQKFTSAGMNSTNPVVGGDGGIPHIDQSDGQIQIASTTGNNFYRSTNGGASFSYMSSVSNNRGQFINPSDYDDNLNTLYSGDNPGNYYYINSIDATPAGSINNLAQIGANREVTAIKVDPFHAATVWLGTNSLATGVIPVVIRVGNANTSSPNVTISTTLAVPAGASISSIDVDPANGNHLLATVSNYGVASVFESTDGGASWGNIEGNLPDMPVYWGIFVPANAQLNGPSGGNGGILLGTELGVWSTSAISGVGTQWIPNGNGFPNVRTDMLKYRASDYTVLAATHGRGLFTTVMPSVPTGINTVSNTKDFIRFATISPSQLYIRTGNLNLNKMQIRVFDMNGRLMHSSDAKYTDQTINVNRLAAGSYILKIYGTRGEQYTWHFVK
jgi:photosystem II stability/assembly factor-like uncharacterized protein